MTGRNINPMEASNTKAWTENEKRLIEANAMDHDVFADRIFEQLEAAPGIITQDQVESIEEKIRTDSVRRAALLFAAMPGSELCKKVENDREFAVAVAHVSSRLESAKDRYQQLSELLDSVNARLMLALCSREDMQAVRAEGEQ